MNRRQVLLGGTAMVAAAAVPVAAEHGIMPFADPHPEMIVAIKLYWDAKEEIIRTSAFAFKDFYLNEDSK